MCFHIAYPVRSYSVCGIYVPDKFRLRRSAGRGYTVCLAVIIAAAAAYNSVYIVFILYRLLQRLQYNSSRAFSGYETVCTVIKGMAFSCWRKHFCIACTHIEIRGRDKIYSACQSNGAFMVPKALTSHIYGNK